MLGNFIESNPIPVKAAMAAMGLLDEHYRLPMCALKPESRQKIANVLKELGLLKAAVA
jgi:4-hydroxy-tetrahydrodipicolinate synthase